MVRKPKRKKQKSPPRSKRMIVLYIISVLVVLSMALGLVLSVASPGRSAPLPVSMTLVSLLI